MSHIEEWTWTDDLCCPGWREALAKFREDGVTTPPGYRVLWDGDGWFWEWSARPEYECAPEESPHRLPTLQLAAASAWRDWES